MQLLHVTDLEQNAHTLHGELHQHWRLGECPDFNDVVFVQCIQSPLRCLQRGQHLIQLVPSRVCKKQVKLMSVRLSEQTPVQHLNANGQGRQGAAVHQLGAGEHQNVGEDQKQLKTEVP